MSFDLVPTNRNFTVTIPGFEHEDDEDNIVASVNTDTGEVTEAPRSTLGFPSNTFTMSNRLWMPFWNWVWDNCQAVLTPEELEMGYLNEGLFVTKKQCECMAKLLLAALEAKVMIYPGSDGLPENTIAVCLLEFLNQCQGSEIW